MVGNLVLVIREFFEYGYPHSNVHLQFYLKLVHCKPHKAACHPRKYDCDVTNDVKLFSDRNFLTLSDVALQQQVH